MKYGIWIDNGLPKHGIIVDIRFKTSVCNKVPEINTRMNILNEYFYSYRFYNTPLWTLSGFTYDYLIVRSIKVRGIFLYSIYYRFVELSYSGKNNYYKLLKRLVNFLVVPLLCGIIVNFYYHSCNLNTD